jgi:pilus assembly protein CpaB
VTAQRRRGLLLLSIALASGGLAASQVRERERRAAHRLGPVMQVLVASRDLPAGTRLTGDLIEFRRVPARFAPPDVLTSPEAALRARTAGPVAAGSYLTVALFAGVEVESRGNGLRRGERAVTVEVAGGGAVAELAPGARVDVLVSTETGAAGGRTTMALGGAELLELGEGGRTAEPGAGPSAFATLRVTVSQAIYLTAADNFAREIRLLPRPPADHSRAGGTVSQGQL